MEYPDIPPNCILFKYSPAVNIVDAHQLPIEQNRPSCLENIGGQNEHLEAADAGAQGGKLVHQRQQEPVAEHRKESNGTCHNADNKRLPITRVI